MELIWGIWFIFGAITGYLVFKAAYKETEARHGQSKFDNDGTDRVRNRSGDRCGNNGCNKQMGGEK